MGDLIPLLFFYMNPESDFGILKTIKLRQFGFIDCLVYSLKRIAILAKSKKSSILDLGLFNIYKKNILTSY
jgi:hypothetical protein